MEKFIYKVKDDQGKTRKGVVEGRDQKQAAKILQERGFLVISLKPKKAGLTTELRRSVFKRIGLTDKVNFTRQLATMMVAGLPLTDALVLLETQSSPVMGQVVAEVLRSVEGGGSLAKALEKHPKAFDQIYTSLVRSGETAGVLDKILSRLADNLEKKKEFNSKVKGAMIYPVIVLIGMVIVMAIMVLFVIPKMTVLYQEFGTDLPIATKILMGISNFAIDYWWLGLAGLVGLIFGLRALLKIHKFKKQVDRLLFKLPVVGELRRRIMLTEFTRTLGLLLGTGILIVDAVNVVCRSLNSPVYEEAMAQAAKEVEKGLPLAAALARTEVFPPILSQMVAVGEETGKIDEVLGKVSVYFEHEAETAVKGLTTAMEPFIMVVLGLGVAFLVMAVITPIYNLTSQF